MRSAYLCFHKDYSQQGPWCAFQFTKVTTASPHITKVHHTFLAALKWKLLNPRQSPGRSGLITIYPRPDETICSYFQYSIKVNLCQHKPSICRYNGLPVHAFAQTGKPLLGIQDAQSSPAHSAGRGKPQASADASPARWRQRTALPVGCPLSSPSNALHRAFAASSKKFRYATAYTNNRADFISPFGCLDNNYLVCII